MAGLATTAWFAGRDKTEGAKGFLECLRPEGCEVLLSYQHKNWRQYAAAKETAYGIGRAYSGYRAINLA